MFGSPSHQSQLTSNESWTVFLGNAPCYWKCRDFFHNVFKNQIKAMIQLLLCLEHQNQCCGHQHQKTLHSTLINNSICSWGRLDPCCWCWRALITTKRSPAGSSVSAAALHTETENNEICIDSSEATCPLVTHQGKHITCKDQLTFSLHGPPSDKHRLCTIPFLTLSKQHVKKNHAEALTIYMSQAVTLSVTSYTGNFLKEPLH